MMDLSGTPGNADGCENTGLAGKAVCKLMKRKGSLATEIRSTRRDRVVRGKWNRDSEPLLRPCFALLFDRRRQEAARRGPGAEMGQAR